MRQLMLKTKILIALWTDGNDMAAKGLRLKSVLALFMFQTALINENY
jgi:hypothetical protein